VLALGDISLTAGRKRRFFMMGLFLLQVFLISLIGGQDPGTGPEPDIAGPEEIARYEVARSTRVLLQGTDRETTLFIAEAPQEGPVIMVIGGVHGDEIAGWLAAELITAWAVDRGTLLVLPRANVPAVETNTRYPPGSCNLNASFPGNAAGNPTERLAAAIFAVMDEYRPHWVVDLHEALEFERAQYGQLGQTIIYPHDAPSLAVVEQILEGLNRDIPEELHQFQIKRGGVFGGTIYASRLLGLESITIETTRKLPLDERINQHLTAVRLLLFILGVEIDETGSGSLSNWSSQCFHVPRVPLLED
jgi:succinylglutamate desuccinylase